MLQLSLGFATNPCIKPNLCRGSVPGWVPSRLLLQAGQPRQRQQLDHLLSGERTGWQHCYYSFFPYDSVLQELNTSWHAQIKRQQLDLSEQAGALDCRVWSF